MQLYQEILMHVLTQAHIQISFPDLQFNAEQIVEGECYKAMQKIREVLKDDSLDDVQCFERIEKIVCIFEEIGSDGGNRHDFG